MNHPQHPRHPQNGPFPPQGPITGPPMGPHGRPVNPPGRPMGPPPMGPRPPMPPPGPQGQQGPAAPKKKGRALPIVAGVVVGALVIGAGAWYATTQLGDPEEAVRAYFDFLNKGARSGAEKVMTNPPKEDERVLMAKVWQQNQTFTVRSMTVKGKDVLVDYEVDGHRSTVSLRTRGGKVVDPTPRVTLRPNLYARIALNQPSAEVPIEKEVRLWPGMYRPRIAMGETGMRGGNVEYQGAFYLDPGQRGDVPLEFRLSSSGRSLAMSAIAEAARRCMDGSAGTGCPMSTPVPPGDLDPGGSVRWRSSQVKADRVDIADGQPVKDTCGTLSITESELQYPTNRGTLMKTIPGPVFSVTGCVDGTQLEPAVRWKK